MKQDNHHPAWAEVTDLCDITNCKNGVTSRRSKGWIFLNSGEFGLLTANTDELTLGSLNHCFPSSTRTCSLDVSLLNAQPLRQTMEGWAGAVAARWQVQVRQGQSCHRQKKKQNPKTHMTPTPRGPWMATILNHSLVTDIRQSGGQSISGHTHTHMHREPPLLQLHG